MHLSAMRHVVARMSDGYEPPPSHRVPDPNAPGADTRQLARIMEKHSNFAALGAIGPDLFFFLPDFRDQGGINLSSVLVGVEELLFDLYEMLDPFIEKYHKFLGPLTQNLEEEISRLTGGLSESVGRVVGELTGILLVFVGEAGDCCRQR